MIRLSGVFHLLSTVLEQKNTEWQKTVSEQDFSADYICPSKKGYIRLYFYTVALYTLLMIIKR